MVINTLQYDARYTQHHKNVLLKKSYLFWMNQENCESWNKYVEKVETHEENKRVTTTASIAF